MHVVSPLVIATVLAGCSASAPAPDDALFPLGAGHRWTYSVTMKFDDPEQPLREEMLVMSSHGAEPVGGAPSWRRRSDSGVEYWLRSDASGIYRVAQRVPLEAAPRLDAAPRFVLRRPIAVGTEWQASTATYLLARRNEIPRDVRRTHPSLAMRYRIEALDESVETPAGRFEHCVRVAGQALINLYVEAQLQWRDLPVDTTEWYCAGVGLVRLDRKEPSPSRFMLGGTVSMVLVSWQ